MDALNNQQQVESLKDPGMQQAEHLIGKRFGRLTIVRLEARHRSNRKIFVCRCDCGSECLKRYDHLKSGASKSCGCLRDEAIRKSLDIQRNGATRDGKQTRTYRIWSGMKKRCFNHNCKSFKYYGARGISVCDRWMEYKNFLSDMGEAPEGMTLERSNNNRGYEPGNCRWATKTEQARNKRNVVLNEVIAAEIRSLYGHGMTQADISRITGVSSASVSNIVLGKQWMVLP